ncbi:MAG TPA: hypothetical protein ENK49_12825 [Gammaproteobacteria bacterium]|nr:hypothetical protein [Gammaproteobacteria bacterium]
MRDVKFRIVPGHDAVAGIAQAPHQFKQLAFPDASDAFCLQRLVVYQGAKGHGDIAELPGYAGQVSYPPVSGRYIDGIVFADQDQFTLSGVLSEHGFRVVEKTLVKTRCAS